MFLNLLKIKPLKKDSLSIREKLNNFLKGSLNDVKGVKMKQFVFEMKQYDNCSKIKEMLY